MDVTTVREMREIDFRAKTRELIDSGYRVIAADVKILSEYNIVYVAILHKEN